MKKRIIFVTTALWVGGIETALVNLTKQLDYGAFEVTLLVTKAELNLLPQVDPRCRVLIADRDRSHSFSEPYRYSRLYHLLEEPSSPSRLHRMFKWIAPVLRSIENRSYIRYIRSCMQNEVFDTAVIYSDAVAELGVKSIRANSYLLFYHHGAMRRAYHDNVAWKRCRHVIAVSEHQAANLRAFRPEFAEKITAIHNLADVDGVVKKAGEEPPQKFDADRFHIVTVGRVSPEKGMDLAVLACKELICAGFDNFCWWIVGEGPAMREVRTLIADNHLNDVVKTVGMAENPYPYIRRADLYVQPSRFEGYPMTLLEALALGCAVVSTANPGAMEVLGAGRAGLLCEATPSAIAETIQTIRKDPSKLAELRRNASDVDLKAENQKALERLYILLKEKKEEDR